MIGRFKGKPKQPRHNALLILERNMEAKHLDVPIGDWYTAGSRTMSMIEKGSNDDFVAWTPTQNSISKEMDIYTPNQLFELLQWEKILKAVYYTPSDIWRKLNTGLMIGLIALLLFFAYLIYSNQTGGA